MRHKPDLFRDLESVKCAVHLQFQTLSLRKVEKNMINDYQPRTITLSLKKVGLLAAYKLNKIPWPQKAEVATAPAPPPKDYR